MHLHTSQTPAGWNEVTVTLKRAPGWLHIYIHGQTMHKYHQQLWPYWFYLTALLIKKSYAWSPTPFSQKQIWHVDGRANLVIIAYEGIRWRHKLIRRGWLIFHLCHCYLTLCGPPTPSGCNINLCKLDHRHLGDDRMVQAAIPSPTIALEWKREAQWSMVYCFIWLSQQAEAS